MIFMERIAVSGPAFKRQVIPWLAAQTQLNSQRIAIGEFSVVAINEDNVSIRGREMRKLVSAEHYVRSASDHLFSGNPVQRETNENNSSNRSSLDLSHLLL